MSHAPLDTETPLHASTAATTPAHSTKPPHSDRSESSASATKSKSTESSADSWVEQEYVSEVQRLSQQYQLPSSVGASLCSVSSCTASFFKRLWQKMRRVGADRLGGDGSSAESPSADPLSVEEGLDGVKALLLDLQRCSGFDVSRISAEKIVHSDPKHLRRLIRVFARIDRRLHEPPAPLKASLSEEKQQRESPSKGSPSPSKPMMPPEAQRKDQRAQLVDCWRTSVPVQPEPFHDSTVLEENSLVGVPVGELKSPPRADIFNAAQDVRRTLFSASSGVNLHQHRPTRRLDRAIRDAKREQLREMRLVERAQQLLRQRIRQDYELEMSRLRASLKESERKARSVRLDGLKQLRDTTEMQRQVYLTLIQSAASEKTIPPHVLTCESKAYARKYAMMREQAVRVTKDLTAQHFQEAVKALERSAVLTRF